MADHPKSPPANDRKWALVKYGQEIPGAAKANRWMLHDTSRDVYISVLSAVDVAEVHGGTVVAPHWHVSAAVLTRRGDLATPTDQQMEQVRGDFGMGGAEEDNHGLGKARHLWMLCGRTTEPECACKQDEAKTVEGDRVRHDPEEVGNG